jgi:subtilase family serine protease
MMDLCSSAPKRFTAATLVGAILCLLAFAWPASAQQQNSLATPRPLITQPVNEQQLTVLRGNTHPLARPEFDMGTAPDALPMQRMLLVLKRSPEQEHALRTLLDDQQDKYSPNYHQWLRPEQYGKQFGPTDADMQVITAWLQSHGFHLGAPSKGRTVIEFSGSASQVQETFHTTIHKYLVNGEQHWANSSDLSIPTALTPAVAGVFSLHNFVRKPLYRLAKERVEAKWLTGQRPQFTTSNGLHALAPRDFNIIYKVTINNNFNPVSIGVVGRSDIIPEDIANFQSVFDTGGQTPQIIVNGPDPGDVPGDDIEGTLDVSWSAAIAVGAQVFFVNSAITNTTDGVVLSELYIIENNLTNVMTYSFGGCEAEFGGEASYDAALAEQAAAQGITFVAASGDAGAEGCDDPNSETVATGPISVNLPASTPFTTAVGGTMFNEGGASDNALYWYSNNQSGLASAIGYIPEDAWNESCPASSCGASANIAAGGGGASTIFPQPTYQSPATVYGVPDNNARNVPDVAFSAAAGHDPYLLCFQGSCIPNAQGEISFLAIGGTSASTPSFAGIMALVDQQMSSSEGPTGARQGLANYVLYPLAAAQQAAGTACNASGTPALTPTSGCVFDDVTAGNNAVPGEVGYGTSSAVYQAGLGYDQATGLGSVNGVNLVNQWTAATFRPTTTTLTASSPTTIQHGQAVSFQITVAPNNGTGTPAGDVSLIAATGPAGSPTNQTSVGGFILSGGTVSASTNQLPGGGPYAVAAHYSGNSTSTPTGVFAPSDSNTLMVTVAPEGSATTLSNFTINNNGQTVAVSNGTSLPFGSFLIVRADVAGLSGQGVPTGNVTFTDTFGSLPGPIFNPVANPVALNSQGNTSIGAGVVNFDAGSHNISASYAGDASFNSSSSAQPVTFTIQPGFAAVSGLANVSITAPGGSGTTTLGIIASSGFTTAVAVTCTGLPAGAACGPTSIPGNGPNNIVTGTIAVTTTAASAATLHPVQRPFYFAMLGAAAMPLGGILVLAVRRKRYCATLLGLGVWALIVGLPACGGGGSGSTQPPPNAGTPAGTYTVKVNAAAGSISGSVGTFTLTVQ